MTEPANPHPTSPGMSDLPLDETALQAAQEALLAYMEWWSEETYCAGWLVNLPDTMARAEIKAFRFLVEKSGGWYIHKKKFISGTYKDLLANGAGENE
jgi:hypothetical protein